MIKACLDTNVLVSGIIFSGAPAEIVSLAFSRKFHLVTSLFILDELERNLVNKFSQSPRKIRKLIYRISEIADVYDPKGTVHLIKECPGDNFVLETAWIGRAKYLVTGDKTHLLPLKVFRNIRIIEPANFLQLLKN